MQKKILSLSYTLDNIEGAVRLFWESLHSYNIFAFSGEMGAGKTTFIHHLCDYLGVEDKVGSPTFALINEYHYNDIQGEEKIIYHLDWYRLKNSVEAINAGMEDCILRAINSEVKCFIEWPEKALGLLQGNYLWIRIETRGIFEREMEVIVNC